MSNGFFHMNYPRRSRGFTLLEVMIALLVLSIGLLGIAALQGVGLRSSHGAYLTSQASLLAYDMADRIRTNPQTPATYNGFDTATVNCSAALPATPLADADLSQWACAVQQLLPNGSAGIFGAAGANGIATYTITVEWEDLQVEGAENPWSFVLTIDI
ncbi:MAG: type IV pilus modification protein PilV [Gammaproteobacteria bacterium]